MIDVLKLYCTGNDCYIAKCLYANVGMQRFIQIHSDPLGSQGHGVVDQSLTWIFSTTTPLDEAHDEQDQYDEGDGAHEADEPALSGDVNLVDVGCGSSGGGRRQ